jgi:hypothetical protein
MAVPALPPENTERWWAVYTVNNHQHHLMIRTNDGQTGSFMSSVYVALFSRLDAVLYALHIENLERAVKNSNVRNIVPFAGDADYGLGSGDALDAVARTISFVGRGVAGHKSRFFVYGYRNDANGDFRTNTAESAQIADVITLINGATGTFLAIDGTQPVWHAYANIGYSDHWIKTLRT